jgi:hypothetical protein
MKRSLALAFVVVFGGSAWASPADEMVRVFERQGADVQAHKSDCDGMLDALLVHVDADAAAMKRLNQSEKGMSPAQKNEAQKKFVAKYGARLKVATRKMAPLGACRDNAKMQTWKNKLEP